jgi:hypothetical protein
MSPLALAEAFDFLDAQWRLVFGREHPLIRAGSLSEAAGIATPCTSKEQFESRMSDLADILDRLTVADELLAEADRAECTGSMNRIASCIRARMAGDAQARALAAVDRLRKIRRVRVALQHSGAAAELPRALSALGLDNLPPDWPAVWRRIVALAHQALHDLRNEVKRVASGT